MKRLCLGTQSGEGLRWTPVSFLDLFSDSGGGGVWWGAANFGPWTIIPKKRPNPSLSSSYLEMTLYRGTNQFDDLYIHIKQLSNFFDELCPPPPQTNRLALDHNRVSA